MLVLSLSLNSSWSNTFFSYCGLPISTNGDFLTYLLLYLRYSVKNIKLEAILQYYGWNVAVLILKETAWAHNK